MHYAGTSIFGSLLNKRHPEPKYDGMAELWLDDAQALLAGRQSPE
jgi:hypothetical protein